MGCIKSTLSSWLTDEADEINKTESKEFKALLEAMKTRLDDHEKARDVAQRDSDTVDTALGGLKRRLLSNSKNAAVVAEIKRTLPPLLRQKVSFMRVLQTCKVKYEGSKFEFDYFNSMKDSAHDSKRSLSMRKLIDKLNMRPDRLQELQKRDMQMQMSLKQSSANLGDVHESLNHLNTINGSAPSGSGSDDAVISRLMNEFFATPSSEDVAVAKVQSAIHDAGRDDTEFSSKTDVSVRSPTSWMASVFGGNDHASDESDDEEKKRPEDVEIESVNVDIPADLA